MRRTRYLLLLLLCVVLCLLASCRKDSQRRFNTLEDIKRADSVKLALPTANSFLEPAIKEELPNVEFVRYTNYFDTFQEILNDKADLGLTFDSTFIGLNQSFPALKGIQSDRTTPIVLAFSPSNEKLKNEFNEFFLSEEFPALLDNLIKFWVDGCAGNTAYVHYEDLENINGMFTLAVSNTNYPLEYYQDSHHAGMEHALIYEFAKRKGYQVEVIETAYDSAVAGAGTGKYDMSMGFYGQSPERSETGNFSIPYMYDHFCYTVNGGDAEESVGFLEGIKLRFERNFIKENRWKLILNGLLSTLEITSFSVLSGTVLGFGLFLFARNHKRLEKTCHVIQNNLESLPTLVILMVFFYVIFSKSTLSGFVVSIIVFSLLFLFTFFSLLSGSVNGIAKGQTEGALALGYTPLQTLFKVLLPQAMDSFLPAYKSAIISTLKGTAIVGYVAVQDLTKAGDLIRSLTFDAFFPIVGIAVVYYLIAKLLIFLMDKFFVIDRKKNTEKYLRGIKK